jgi:hypothetical protein
MLAAAVWLAPNGGMAVNANSSSFAILPENRCKPLPRF